MHLPGQQSDILLSSSEQLCQACNSRCDMGLGPARHVALSCLIHPLRYAAVNNTTNDARVARIEAHYSINVQHTLVNIHAHPACKKSP